MNDSPPPPPSDDVLEHVWNAAQEFLKAMRGLVDAADEFVREQRTRTAPETTATRVQHIDIDDDLGDGRVDDVRDVR